MADSPATHEYWMQQAIALAAEAGAVGEVPVGAVLVNQDQQAISATQNRKQRDQDPLPMPKFWLSRLGVGRSVIGV